MGIALPLLPAGMLRPAETPGWAMVAVLAGTRMTFLPARSSLAPGKAPLLSQGVVASLRAGHRNHLADAREVLLAVRGLGGRIGARGDDPGDRLLHRLRLQLGLLDLLSLRLGDGLGGLRLGLLDLRRERLDAVAGDLLR